jgi:integral membrane sensor domain MASE1
MSWELEHLERRGWNRRAGSPVALVGFILGLMAMSTSVFLYYWLLAPVATLAVTAVFAIASVFARKHRKHSERFAHLVDGALAATAFAVIFAIVGAIALAN